MLEQLIWYTYITNRKRPGKNWAKENSKLNSAVWLPIASKSSQSQYNVLPKPVFCVLNGYQGLSLFSLLIVCYLKCLSDLRTLVYLNFRILQEQ